MKPEKILPTTVEFVDIAGLVAGASQGEGLGNQFLSHIRETDAIAHVVRCFESTDIVHVSGKVDPIADIEVIDTELALADLQTVEKAVDRAGQGCEERRQGRDSQARAVRARERRISTRRSPCARCQMTEEERRDVREMQLLTAKPIMYVANVAENGFTNNPHARRGREARGRRGRGGRGGVRGHRGGDLAARGSGSRGLPRGARA